MPLRVEADYSLTFFRHQVREAFHRDLLHGRFPGNAAGGILLLDAVPTALDDLHSEALAGLADPVPIQDGHLKGLFFAFQAYIAGRVMPGWPDWRALHWRPLTASEPDR
jgi:hypothetical protein